MKKIVGGIIFLALCPALAWGYFRALETYIPALLLPETAVREESPQMYAEVKRAAASPSKRVIKIAPQSTPARGMDEIVSEVLFRSENLEEHITVDINGFSGAEIADALLESGKYYGLSWTSIGSRVTLTPDYKISEEIFYLLRTGDESPISSEAKSVLEASRAIIGQTVKSSMDDYEKALAIHDYLVKTGEYDMSAARHVTSGSRDFSDDEDSFSVYGLLFGKKGVCQAYSEAFNIFMKLLEIECEELAGEADGTPHSWNRIKLGGKYYHIDATFDDPYPDKPGEVSHAYFCLTDDMISKDHKWRKDDIKCDSLDYNYFVRNNLVVSGQSDFDRVIEEAAKSGARYAEMRLEGFSLDHASFDRAARVTGLNTFTMSELGELGVVKVYLK